MTREQREVLIRLTGGEGVMVTKVARGVWTWEGNVNNLRGDGREDGVYPGVERNTGNAIFKPKG